MSEGESTSPSANSKFRAGLGTLVDFMTVAACLVVVAIGLRMLLQERDGSEDDVSSVEVVNWSAISSGPLARGPINSPVTIVEFGDYECPACMRTEQAIRGVLANFPKDVRVVYRHYPLDYHSAATPAARAATCAAELGSFEAFHASLYNSRSWQKNFSESLPTLAIEAGIEDRDAFLSCVGNYEATPSIVEDKRLGDEAGLRFTPTLVVNGLRLETIPDSLGLDSLVRASLVSLSSKGM